MGFGLLRPAQASVSTPEEETNIALACSRRSGQPHPGLVAIRPPLDDTARDKARDQTKEDEPGDAAPIPLSNPGPDREVDPYEQEKGSPTRSTSL